MAGTSLADFLFILASSRVVDKFEDACRSAGYHNAVDCEGAAAHFGIHQVPAYVNNGSIVYVDDLYKPVLCDAEDVIDVVKGVAKIAISIFSACGFEPNFHLASRSV
eukprot:8944491-Karenia_brevis.AAC.1